MTKKCLGCDNQLQDKDPSKKGYANKNTMDYCRECFRLKHYGENTEKKVNNDLIIKQINNKNMFNLFFINYLNISEKAIDIYKDLDKPKLLIFTKMDLYPNNLIYKIDENFKQDFLFLSSKSKTSIKNLNNFLKANDIKEVVISGLTNSGKSTFLNNLADRKITVSNLKNVTKDYIKVKYDGITYTDSPGFDLNYKNHDKKVVKYTFQMKENETLKINNYYLKFQSKDNVTIYSMFKLNIKKDFKKRDFSSNINVKGQDMFLEDIGFISFTRKNKISINSENYYLIDTVLKG